MQQQFYSNHTAALLLPELICGFGVCVSTKTAWREHFKRSLQQVDWGPVGGCVSPQELYHSRREHSLQTIQWLGQMLWLNGLVIHYRRGEMKENRGSKYVLCCSVFLYFSWRGRQSRRIRLPEKTLDNVASQLQSSSHSSCLTRLVISCFFFADCTSLAWEMSWETESKERDARCMWSPTYQQAAGDCVLP